MKIVPLTVLLLLGGIASPAAAESIASCRDVWVPSPSDASATTTEISQNAPAIIAALRARGVQVEDITDWGGCVRADVRTPDGKTRLEFFDPDSLQQLSVD